MRRWRTCAALIETNYQSLTGISQAYLGEQRGKLDTILQGYLNRLMAVQRYERLPAGPHDRRGGRRRSTCSSGAGRARSAERAAAALKKNLELKRKLLTSISEVGGTVKALVTELDSIESLLEMLHQNSISLRDPQAISQISTRSSGSPRSPTASCAKWSRCSAPIPAAGCPIAPRVPPPAASTRAPDTRNVRTKAKER